MAANTDRSRPVARTAETSVPFDCPECQATVTRRHGSVLCPDCGFAPRHGAD